MAGLYDRQHGMAINVDQKIVVAGCGGIGWHVTKMLAMAGVEHLTLFDPDVFEEHNLNRIDITIDAIGKNKAELAEEMVTNLRPQAYVSGYPSPLKEHMITGEHIDWIVDCTDNFQSQTENQKIASSLGTKYMKAGYNGWSMSISHGPAGWDTGQTPDGYTITPSFVVPAVVVAALTVGKVLKYGDKQLSCELKDLYL